jgi:opacity protein-like surface antigen
VSRALVLLSTGLAVGLTGCAGTALLQSARTLPKGEVKVTTGIGYLGNELSAERFALNNLPLQVGVRVGVAEHLELSVRNLATGLVLGAKYNLMPTDSPVALAVLVGAGGAWTPETSALHAQATFIASYDWGPVTPYLGAGYGAWWFFHDFSRAPGVQYAARTGTGDGTLELKAGLEFRVSPRIRLLVEYGYSRPLVDDPGDFFSLVPSHLGAVGVVF